MREIVVMCSCSARDRTHFSATKVVKKTDTRNQS